MAVQKSHITTTFTKWQ